MNASGMKNPFAQSATKVQAVFISTYDMVGAIEAVFEDIALATSSFAIEVGDPADEKIAPESDWKTTILLRGDDASQIAARTSLIGELTGQTIAPPHISPVQDKDWVSEVQASFRPIRAGRFYVYGSHITDPMPHGTLPILLDAGAAFGTGEHDTTAGCLEALCLLAKSHRFSRVLDMGAGSGILGMGAAMLWQCPVLATDIDAVAAKVAAANVARNRLGQWVHCAHGNGYAAPAVNGKYDLIIANILARPLMLMAKDLKRHLAPGGTAVLSGLLVRQERMVLMAHAMQGLRLKHRIRRGYWSTLILG